jgi:hypothetical protein
MKAWLAAGLLLGLAACEGSQAEYTDEAVAIEAYSPPPSPAGATEATAEAPPPVQARMAPPPAPPSGAVQPSTTPVGAPPQGVTPLLAYSYTYGLEAPPAGVRALLRRHEQACQAAGPTTCQVIGATSEQRGENDITARLEFRATPAYTTRFRGGLERDAAGARGEVTASKVETEDLTRSIIDTEARLRAGRLLRTRLEALIASRPGNLEQLLEIERELARVQGELDAAESTLAVMRARVSMSTVTVDYASRGAVVDPGDGRPLKDAGDRFARNLAASSAAILTFISLVLPWAAVIGLAAWALLALARRGKAGSARAKPKGEAPPPAPAPADFSGPSRPGD